MRARSNSVGLPKQKPTHPSRSVRNRIRLRAEKLNITRDVNTTADKSIQPLGTDITMLTPTNNNNVTELEIVREYN